MYNLINHALQEMDMNNINQQIIDLRKETELNRKAFAEHFGIPLRTVEEWEAGRRTPPEHVPRLIKYQIEYEKLVNDNAEVKHNK